VLPFYAKRLGAAGAHVGGLETVYGVGQVAGALLLGWLSDAHGRKAVLLLSFMGAAAGYGMAAGAVAAASVPLLLLSRLPVGLAKQARSDGALGPRARCSAASVSPSSASQTWPLRSALDHRRVGASCDRTVYRMLYSAVERAVLLYSTIQHKSCCIGQYSGNALSRARCIAMQQCSLCSNAAIHHNTVYNTIYTPPLGVAIGNLPSLVARFELG
jgi:hypothetical protein